MHVVFLHDPTLAQRLVVSILRSVGVYLIAKGGFLIAGTLSIIPSAGILCAMVLG